jgi:hypothetical protein
MGNHDRIGVLDHTWARKSPAVADGGYNNDRALINVGAAAIPDNSIHRIAPRSPTK